MFLKKLISLAAAAFVFTTGAQAQFSYDVFPGEFDAVPVFGELEASHSGQAAELSDIIPTGEAAAVRARGALTVETGGAHRFTVSTPHKAVLSLDGAELLSVNGVENAAFIVLEPGEYAIEIGVLAPSGLVDLELNVRRPFQSEAEPLGGLVTAAANSLAAEPAAGVFTTANTIAPPSTTIDMDMPTTGTPTQMQGEDSIQSILDREIRRGPRDPAPTLAEGTGLRDFLQQEVRTRAFNEGLSQGEISIVVVQNGSGSGAYRVGQEFQITADAAPEGQTFDRWIGSTIALNDPAAATTSLRAIAGGVSVAAVYAGAPAPQESALTVNGGSGSGSYLEGQEISIIASEAPAGQEFIRWTGDTSLVSDAFSAQTFVTMGAAAATVTATFGAAQATYALTVENGAGSGDYAPGASVAITANAPAEGQEFAGWTGDVSLLTNAASASQTFTMPAAPVSLSATYRAQRADVSVANGSGSGRYQVGLQIVIQANPAAAGQTFTSWSGDVAALGDANAPVTTLTVPEAGASVTANYAASNISITSQANGDIVDEQGFTVAGTVSNPQTLSSLTAEVMSNGTLMASELVSFHPTSGAFALRVFDEAAPAGAPVSVRMTANRTGGGADTASLGMQAARQTDEVRQLLNRITFGATPALLERVREVGFDTYLNEQLQPDFVNDDAFMATNPDDRFDFTDNNGGQKEKELFQIRLDYAINSERQLREVMAYFWENHFHTDPDKENDYGGEFAEMQAFRANALGYFRDLLNISATSSVMMSYLDNDDSRAGNLNENYARELLELHTVSVESTYTSEDIVEIARILTGWREREANPDRPDGYLRLREFYFDEDRHDTGNKVIGFLNANIQGRQGPEGFEEGQELLDILAQHPDTARFICKKMIQYFVNDAPPAGLLETCSSAYLDSGGHIATILQLILTSPDFRSTPDNYRSKFKTPLEYTASLARSFDVAVTNAEELDNFYNDMKSALEDAGQDLYEFSAPTGFPEVGAAWTGAASLVKRFQYALDLLRDSVPGDVQPNYQYFIDNAPAATAEGVAISLFQHVASDRFEAEEYAAVVDALYGSDQVFDPAGDEEAAMIRAAQLIAAMPSFQYQ